MILKENDFLYKCKLMSITAIQADEILKSSNVVLKRDLEEFLDLCHTCGTSVIFYDFKYYRKSILRIDESIKAREMRCANEYKKAGEFRANIAQHIDKWNELIEDIDYSQPCELRLVASIDGVVTETVLRDSWLKLQYDDVCVHVLSDGNSANIASDISHQLVVKRIFG